MTNGEIQEPLKREIWYRFVGYRFIVYLSVIAGGFAVSETAVILVAIASSVFEIWYKIWSSTSEISNKIEELKPGFVKMLDTESNVAKSIARIVEDAEHDDTIYLSAHEAPDEEAIKKFPHYDIATRRAKNKEIFLKRLVYVAKFEEKEKDYTTRIQKLKNWIEKDQIEIGGNYDVRCTDIPFFFVYIYLDAKKGRSIFQMSIPSKPPFKEPIKHALYVEGDMQMFKPFGEAIRAYWDAARLCNELIDNQPSGEVEKQT